MQGGEDLSIEELASNLSTYKDQLREIKKILADDPGNSEYIDMEKELEEVIALTEELLTTAKPTDFHRLDSVASPNTHFDGTSHSKASSEYSQPYGSFPVGTKVQAVWSEDEEWYDATIESITPNGYFISYEVWGNTEEVDFANVRPVEEVNALLEAEREAEATRQAIKRKIAQAAITDFQARTLPAKLRIDPNDPDDVKAAKRKKIHSFKSKVRSEQLEVAQNKRQNAWQQFQSAKGKTKKIGFFSGRKRESIFKSPDDPNGKVGVIGSGKGLTEFQKREKHLHLKGGTVDTEE
ncbi:survival of motor neuron-related-splicing factor 30-like [Zingiber officinale]|uniref:survival of motor neuron-related-splicing factor 30-like n=1 Tax=Zingiber officinale TaxID=94328 RepID=UPI001C4B8A78|nr:survival of motor neuron-related-splicing factor 30-like [Zingiber officinale]